MDITETVDMVNFSTCTGQDKNLKVFRVTEFASDILKCKKKQKKVFSVEEETRTFD